MISIILENIEGKLMVGFNCSYIHICMYVILYLKVRSEVNI